MDKLESTFHNNGQETAADLLVPWANFKIIAVQLWKLMCGAIRSATFAQQQIVLHTHTRSPGFYVKLRCFLAHRKENMKSLNLESLAITQSIKNVLRVCF